YVVLYVNCAILCQKLRLGIIVLGPGDTLLRSIGVGVTLVGLYLCLRGVMRSGKHSVKELETASQPINSSVELSAGVSAEATASPGVEPNKEAVAPAITEGSTVLSQEPTRPPQNQLDPHRSSPFRMEGSRLVYSSMVSHIPPTRFAFITRNLLCLGALLIFAGLPLVFQAWFPLVAIPGIFIVMSWMFSGKSEK